MNTAANYVRVSTADQHVESHLYDLREFAAKRGFEVVVKEYRDCGVSGRRVMLARVMLVAIDIILAGEGMGVGDCA